MDIEKRQSRLQKNGDALDYWIGRLLRAATQIDKLRKERRRLMGKRVDPVKHYRSLEEIRQGLVARIGNGEFNDDIPS